MTSPALTPARSTGRAPFDADQLRRAFRAAAARHGIDPQAGSTSYQAANLRAALRQAALRRGAHPVWWSDPDIWVDAPPYRSIVEQAAVERLFFAAYWRALRRAQMEAVRVLT